MKKIFFAYSDNEKDVELYKQFNKHFAAYAKKGLIAIVDKDELFRVNNDKEKVIEFLQNADLTIPLLSVDYATSDDCINMLGMATDAKKIIIPVLLRDFDWKELDGIRNLENVLLPEDKQSVNAHISSDNDKDAVFAIMAKKVKAIVFNDFEGIEIKKNKGTFYYILATILLIIGILAGYVGYTLANKNWQIGVIIFLMFGCIALFSVKNVLFPTKFKIN